jgi:hypothetical protein
MSGLDRGIVIKALVNVDEEGRLSGSSTAIKEEAGAFVSANLYLRYT